MDSNLGRWALMGFNGQISILLSADIYAGPYYDACKKAEKLALESNLECGIAMEIGGAFNLLKQSAKISNQKVK